jgi:hypothetical protein
MPVGSREGRREMWPAGCRRRQRVARLVVILCDLGGLRPAHAAGISYDVRQAATTWRMASTTSSG